MIDLVAVCVALAVCGCFAAALSRLLSRCCRCLMCVCSVTVPLCGRNLCALHH